MCSASALKQIVHDVAASDLLVLQQEQPSIASLGRLALLLLLLLVLLALLLLLGQSGLPPRSLLRPHDRLDALDQVLALAQFTLTDQPQVISIILPMPLSPATHCLPTRKHLE